MPNRIIKESICESKTLSEVSFFAEDLYKRLITYADDYGRFNADYQVLRARLYPRELEIVREEDIEDALTELIGVGKIAFYTSRPRKEVYGCFPHWAEHQRIRDSKHKLPDPEDTDINDWYLRRFIPIDLRVKIIERDKFKCQECGKYVCAGETSARRLVKMGAGLLHIDHIVPLGQGGRATEENLRLLCPRCNLKRKKRYTIDEIIEFTKRDYTLQESAASRGELPPNPIQSNPNPIQNNTSSSAQAPCVGDRFARFWKAYPKKVGKGAAEKSFNRINPDDSLLETMITAVNTAKASAQWQKENGQFIPNPSTWLNQRRWEDEIAPSQPQREVRPDWLPRIS